MDKVQIKALLETYEQKAQKAYMAYQETGITRYDTARRKAEDLADALRMALNAKDEHDELLLYRAKISEWASEAKRIPYMSEAAMPEAMERICLDVKSLAKMKGLIRED